MARQALRKIGVERITVTPDADGWTFEGLADLSRLVYQGVGGSGAAPPDVYGVE